MVLTLEQGWVGDDDIGGGITSRVTVTGVRVVRCRAEAGTTDARRPTLLPLK
jgi:hypothetical protein